VEFSTTAHPKTPAEMNFLPLVPSFP
jgi:hypothetical protein